MPSARLADLLQELEGQLEGLQELLKSSLDFAALEEVVTASLDRVAATVLANVLEALLSDMQWLRSLNTDFHKPINRHIVP